MAVGAAAVAPLALWMVLELGLGFNVQAPAMGDYPEPMDLGALHIVMPGLLGGLAGWGLMALLERFTVRARNVWAAIAVIFLLASLITPLAGTDITPAQRSALIAMHLVVGAVVIPVFYRTSRAADG